MRAAPSMPWHTLCLTSLRTGTSWQLCTDFGGGCALQDSGKTIKLSEDVKGIAFSSSSRILLCMALLSANFGHDASPPWQQPAALTRVRTTACLGGSPGCLNTAVQLHSAPFFSRLLRPAWTWVLTCPGLQTLFSQVCMSQGSWDLWVLKNLLPAPPHFTPWPLPQLCPTESWSWHSQSSHTAWSLSFGLHPRIQLCPLLRHNVPTCVLWTYLPALSSDSALACLSRPHSQAGRGPVVSLFMLISQVCCSYMCVSRFQGILDLEQKVETKGKRVTESKLIQQISSVNAGWGITERKFLHYHWQVFLWEDEVW